MDALRKHVLSLLAGKEAHIGFAEAVAGFPVNLRGKRIDSAPHTAWQLVEHIRIAQRDILDFSRDSGHKSPKWPDGYWPKTETVPNSKAWAESVRQYKADLAAMKKLIASPKADLLAPIPGGDGQTLLREALLVADHTAYHLGQLMFLRKMLGAWQE